MIAQVLAEIIKKIAVMQGLIEDPHPFISAHDAAEQEGGELAKAVAGLGGEKR